jgi:hypothetical protein
MYSFTTNGIADRLYSDDFRSNGYPNVWILQNESGTIELEALTEEVTTAAEFLQILLDSDVIPDDAMITLIEYLNSARLLADPIT